MNSVLLSSLAVGFVMGLRHAFDPDHVAAVSTIVGESKNLKRASLIGTCWGMGHTLSLLAVGIAVIVFKLTISDRMALWLEFAVALMLIVLGARGMRSALNGWRLHTHQHQHDGSVHKHLHVHGPLRPHLHLHRHLIRTGGRPFAIGMVHGLAGSAGLMVLVLATIPTAVSGLLYIAMFGLGSVGGMLLMSSLISLPFVYTARRFRNLGSGLQFVAAVVSLAFGLFLVWQYGVNERLIF